MPTGDRGRTVTALGRRARGAATEQLEPVAVDAEAGPPLDRPDDVADPAVVDLGRPPASLADDVVVVGRFAPDVGVLAVRQVEPLDDVQLAERVQGPEHRRPPDPQPPDVRRRPADRRP